MRLIHEVEFLWAQVDGDDIVDGIRERGDGIQAFDVILNDRDYGEVAQALSLNELDEGDELCPWARSWGVENEVGLVQELLLASVLDGHQDLSRNFLLFVDMFLDFIPAIIACRFRESMNPRAIVPTFQSIVLCCHLW